MPSGNANDPGPCLECLGPGGSILGDGEVIAAEGEEVVDPIVGGEEALCLAGIVTLTAGGRLGTKHGFVAPITLLGGHTSPAANF